VFLQQHVVGIFEPNADAHRLIENGINAARRRNSSYERLVSALHEITTEPFVCQIKKNLLKIQQRSQVLKASFPAETVLTVLSYYCKLLHLYLTKEALCLLESSTEYAAMLKSRDRQQCEQFGCLFTEISESVPLPFLQAFGEHVDLAIECWAKLAWPDRERLSAGFLIREIFKELDTIQVANCTFSWRPPQDCCDCAISEGEFRTDVTKLLSSITIACNVVSGFNHNAWENRVQSVADRCLQEWESKNFSNENEELPELPHYQKTQQNLLQDMTLERYRSFVREEHTKGQEKASIVGGKEMLLLALQQNPYKATGTAIGLIEQVKAFVKHHKTIDRVTVVPDTCLSTNLYLLQMETLMDGRWVSTEVVDFAFTQYALLTGGCCDKFPDPLASVAPKVFYCDTTVFSDIIPNNKTWAYDIRKYDFLFIPAFVDGNHYIGMGITITGLSGCLLSFDSFGCSRNKERRMVLDWLKQMAPDIAWSHTKGSCPLQKGNYVDCAILTWLCGTYFDKVSAERIMTEFYSLDDAAAVRKQLVLLSISVGNDLRSGTPWTPFSDDWQEGGPAARRQARGAGPGNPTTTGRVGQTGDKPPPPPSPPPPPPPPPQSPLTEGPLPPPAATKNG
jgi:hypothetical protein